MISLTYLLIFLGFYFWYSTTSRIKIQPVFGMENWAQKKKMESKILGSLLLCLGWFLLFQNYGMGASSFHFLIALMTIASSVIVFMPLGILSLKTMILLLFLMLFFEYIIT